MPKGRVKDQFFVKEIDGRWFVSCSSRRIVAFVKDRDLRDSCYGPLNVNNLLPPVRGSSEGSYRPGGDDKQAFCRFAFDKQDLVSFEPLHDRALGQDVQYGGVQFLEKLGVLKNSYFIVCHDRPYIVQALPGFDGDICHRIETYGRFKVSKKERMLEAGK